MASRRTSAKKAAAAMVTVALLALSGSGAAAVETSYPSDGDHPLRVVDYFVAPVGTVLEWTVMRPLAFVGGIVAPYHHIDNKGFKGCSRERPARSCTNIVK